MDNEYNSEFTSENFSETSSEISSEDSSEDSSETSSEISSENTSEISSEGSGNVVYTEIALSEETASQIAQIHTVCITGLALFGTMFFLWLLDFCYKKFSSLF